MSVLLLQKTKLPTLAGCWKLTTANKHCQFRKNLGGSYFRVGDDSLSACKTKAEADPGCSNVLIHRFVTDMCYKTCYGYCYCVKTHQTCSGRPPCATSGGSASPHSRWFCTPAESYPESNVYSQQTCTSTFNSTHSAIRVHVCNRFVSLSRALSLSLLRSLCLSPSLTGLQKTNEPSTNVILLQKTKLPGL